MTVVERVAHAAARLRRAGLEPAEAAADAELLARHVLGWSRASYLAHRREPAPADFDGAYRPLVARRVAREPTSLIRAQREFWGLTFAVTPGVLTPRPETELLVEASVEHLASRADQTVSIADIGTGSGCLAVALATALPRARVVAIDVSRRAVALARRNAAAHGVGDRVTVVEASLSTWRPAADGEGAASRFDLIVANLPYIPTAETRRLAPEVRRFEPAVALDGGADGLDVIRRLLALAPARLRPHGRLLLEIGRGQAPALVRAVGAIEELRMETFRRDLRGIERVAVVTCPPPPTRPTPRPSGTRSGPPPTLAVRAA